MTTRIVGTAVLEGPGFVPLQTEDEIAVQQQAKTDERILALFLSLSKKRTEAINARASSGVESRWLEDMAAYHGEEGYGTTEKPKEPLSSVSRGKKQKRRSTQYVQKTRQKTNAGSARLSDMLLPTDDRNWEYEPTPVPELMSLVKNGQDQVYLDPRDNLPKEHPEQPPPIPPTPDNPNPQQPPPRMLTAADMASERMQLAVEKAKGMQREVDDQLSECQFNAACRRAIDSAAQLGTGIIRGPVPVNRVKKKWTPKKDDQGKTFFDLEILEETRPQTTFVSVWDAFPAPGCGEDIHDGGYFWHREAHAPMHLKDLARLEDSGYRLDAILACLKESPMRTQAMGVPEGRWTDDSLLRDKSNYEIWNYYGEADPDDLEALGVDMSGVAADEIRLKSIGVVVSICNDRIIRAIVNPQAKREIPYDFFQWEMVSGSCWGVGVPYLMRYAQKAMNAAWRQMQDNAGVSHGPQILLNKEAVHPANGDWELHGMKVWYMDDNVDPRMAFAVHHIPSNQVELQNIFMLASQLADEETSLPQLLQGDGAPDTMGATVIAQNNANVVLKRFARNWDDKITGPHLRRYYDWNMEFNANEEVKGDFFVKARGSTHLVVRDIRQQEMMLIAQMRQTDPAVNEWINPEKWAKRTLEATSVGDIMYTENEKMENDRKKAQMPPPVDPRIEAAKINAQAQVRKVELEGQSEQQNIALNAEAAGRNDEREMAKMDYDMRMKEMDVNLAMLKFAHENQMQLNEVKAQLAGKVIEQRTRVQMDRENRASSERQAKLMGKFDKPKPEARAQ